MKHSPHDPLSHLHERLAQLNHQGLLRSTPEPRSPAALSFCSNDYLGLASDPPPAQAPSGSGASRLIAGERHEHGALERELAGWLRTEASLLFTSGYAANLGALAALAGPGDLIVSDALNHASLIDGARLSRARVAVVPHVDLGAIEGALRQRTERTAIVAVESYYSMDADGPDLPALRALCDEHGAVLYVDEAHALGVFGPDGRGLAAETSVMPDVLVGTLGKSLGAQGAFVAGRKHLRDWLWNRARSFVFSTGLAPSSAAAGLRGLQEARRDPERRGRVLRHAVTLRAGLAKVAHEERPDGGIAVVGFGHVVPVILGAPRTALRVADALQRRGIHALAVRPPTVPAGTSRLRLTVSAAHSAEDIERVVVAFREALIEERSSEGTGEERA